MEIKQALSLKTFSLSCILSLTVSNFVTLFLCGTVGYGLIHLVNRMRIVPKAHSADVSVSVPLSGDPRFEFQAGGQLQAHPY
jgi:hypothetical protein